MKLHGIPMSPFVQRVLMAAQIKGIEIELAALPAGGMQTPEFAAISPTRRMPVLEESDGWRVVESGPIVAYLDETQPGPPLFPRNARAAAKARAIASIVDAEVHAGLRHFGLQKIFGSGDCEALLDYGSDQIAVGLDSLERMGVGSDLWAVGDAPSIADITFVPTLALGKIIAEVTDAGALVAGRPGIDAYWARVQADPIAARVYADIRDGFRQFLQLA
jgi:glutathione S-transferase